MNRCSNIGKILANKLFFILKIISKEAYIVNKNISVIQLHDYGIAKYVLLQTDNEVMLIADPKSEYHSDIVMQFKSKDGKNLKCLGGGRIDINEERIKVYGYSIAYGLPPVEMVSKILTENLKNKKIEINIGEGY
jgi:hypothetical protein